MGLPFMPAHGIHGSDYEKIRKDFRKIRDPYSGKEIFVVPAITPDVCLIHALLADPFGNLVIPGSEAHRLAALAARRTIATAEEVVREDRLHAGRGQTFLSALHVDAVVHNPLGAHPTSCQGRYPIDEDHITVYLEHAKDEGSFQRYLSRFVMDMDEPEYIDKVGRHFLKNAFS